MKRTRLKWEQAHTPGSRSGPLLSPPAWRGAYLTLRYMVLPGGPVGVLLNAANFASRKAVGSVVR